MVCDLDSVPCKLLNSEVNLYLYIYAYLFATLKGLRNYFWLIRCLGLGLFQASHVTTACLGISSRHHFFLQYMNQVVDAPKSIMRLMGITVK